MQKVFRQLQSAFEFAETDLERESGDRVEGRILSFIGREVGRDPLRAGWHVGMFAPPLESAEVAPLQEHVRQYLDALAGGQLVNPPHLSITLGVPLSAFGAAFPCVVAGSVTDRYLLTLALLVGHAGGRRVLKCPQCGRAFLKVGRRRYCRRPECERARNGAYWQGYKASPKGRRTVRAARKRQYEAHGWTLGARRRKRPARAR